MLSVISSVRPSGAKQQLVGVRPKPRLIDREEQHAMRIITQTLPWPGLAMNSRSWASTAMPSGPEVPAGTRKNRLALPTCASPRSGARLAGACHRHVAMGAGAVQRGTVRARPIVDQPVDAAISMQAQHPARRILEPGLPLIGEQRGAVAVEPGR